MPWLAPGLCSLSLPRSRGVGEETENRGWLGASSKELWPDLKMSGCFPSKDPSPGGPPVNSHFLQHRQAPSAVMGLRDELG